MMLENILNNKRSLLGLLIFGIVIGISVYFIGRHPQNGYEFTFLKFNNIQLTLSFKLDTLGKIMLSYILIIGYFINQYAKNYLESDSTRVRFSLQVNLVLLSVSLLVVAANLFTAFVAWQLIGINLYLLLNHYHYDVAANKAAKKKFVINRVGDSSFLLALVLAYQTQSADSFLILQSSPNAGFICGLLFISVMTKCAQFPFHIWLIDTMETPTPVSALMHAGVINAGGILLIRISSTLTQYQYISYVILFVGLLTALLSINWMRQQASTKKKLAYSTMGQMGYMLVQCSLGAFPVAIFHLISHGFYKASLFLTAGETLTHRDSYNDLPINNFIMLKALTISLLMLFTGLFLLKDSASTFPILLYGFILVTVMTMLIKVDLIIKSDGFIRYFFYLSIAILLWVYLYFLQLFCSLLVQYSYTNIIPLSVQLLVLAALLVFQYYFWTRSDSRIRIGHELKDRTEYFFRQLVLFPIRLMGDIVNKPRMRKAMSIAYIVAFVAMLMVALCSLNYHRLVYIPSVSKTLTLLCLLVSAVALVLANRCLSIKLLLKYLILFELAFINIAFVHGTDAMNKIAGFHFIAISLVLLMIGLLIKPGNINNRSTAKENRFPIRILYLISALLLLIGIPGTASFISEFYLLNTLMGDNFIFTVLYISLFILLAIVVKHSLQLYVFNSSHINLLSKPITRNEHVIYTAIIIFNVIAGCWPKLILNYI